MACGWALSQHVLPDFALDIDKFTSESGHKWEPNFSIFDESDAQSLVKDIVINQLNLDEKKFEPRSVRFAISNAKNQGWTPQQYQLNESGFKARQIAQVYEAYQAQLAANNALDFDDLIFLPVKLFRQNPEVLAYWHDRFKHILVDEYQDTNRTQYELIRLLATGNLKSNRRILIGRGDRCLRWVMPIRVSIGFAVLILRS
jgi:DNA helicase-2/ATP-dependent DNA helicase PcrA